MIDPIEWLGQWGDLIAPGRHSRMDPAGFARGYRYDPRPKEAPYSMWDRVIRAIPVDGTVADAPPSWYRSPQARGWLAPEKPTLRERLIAWLKSPADGSGSRQGTKKHRR